VTDNELASEAKEATRRRVRPHHAASLILLRENAGIISVLMGRRGRSARFMPGFYVCPGGRVAEDDRATWRAEVGAPPATDAPASLRSPRAALRETYEETGLLVGSPSPTVAEGARFPIETAYAAKCIAPDLGLLTYIGRAITPTVSPMRFDTRFFLADGKHAVGALADSAELDDVAWHAADPKAERPMSGVTRFMLARALDVWRGDAAPAPLYRHIKNRAYVATPGARLLRR